MSKNIEEHKRRIKRSIMIYIIGCSFFVLLALGSLWLGYYILRNYGKHDIPTHMGILSAGGILLLWEMAKSFRLKSSLPHSYKPITREEFPALFSIIDEVTANLNLAPMSNVYICPDATAAVFIQPVLSNLVFEPKKSLVMGLGFLTQMDDDEIRAVLYHEFGHYAQEEMKESVSVYTIGQLSRSFVAIKKPKQHGTWEMQLKSQILLFTYFAIWICNRINKAYSKLAKQMEYDADDIAARHVGTACLQRALLHAAVIKYNYDMMQWGMQQLHAQNIAVNNEYAALALVNNYSHPTRNMLPAEILRRIERLGELKSSNNKSATTVKNGAEPICGSKEPAPNVCTAARFAEWMQQGCAIYTQQRRLSTSVYLEIHLAKKRHKLPLVDSAAYRILIDGKHVGYGNFIKGFTIKKKTSPGKHTLTAYAPSGVISTPFEFEVEENRAYRIEMDYKVYIRKGLYDVFGEKIETIR